MSNFTYDQEHLVAQSADLLLMATDPGEGIDSGATNSLLEVFDFLARMDEAAGDTGSVIVSRHDPHFVRDVSTAKGRNESAAHRGERHLGAYQQETGYLGGEDLGNLLADLMHARGSSAFDEALSDAWGFYNAELRRERDES